MGGTALPGGTLLVSFPSVKDTSPTRPRLNSDDVLRFTRAQRCQVHLDRTNAVVQRTQRRLLPNGGGKKALRLVAKQIVALARQRLGPRPAGVTEQVHSRPMLMKANRQAPAGAVELQVRLVR